MRISDWSSDVCSSDLMSLRPWRDIERRKSRQIMIGNVPVGGDAPVTVQTMTNTLTSDARATIDQIRRCEEAGADLIRVSCPDEESTTALRQIRSEEHTSELQSLMRTSSAVFCLKK